ncbi:hypothetical protein SAMN05444004_104154 [Jannaschia faecimaris]|uniref:DUF985 domain-containing protein n=1 Tax=Jannaschia faecimaris TaxID=1244108 RepID=A0A1H3NYE5_9RHOB|nr:cupin domain-containing protein [Jannaschia faecimaris]SDY93585.1 hypothetical protein SAMN05444004_104154 [Jannaschia faecimaris]
MTSDEIIARLELAPHPEGGFFRQTFQSDALDGMRPAGTAILFLLQDGPGSHWHRVDADELWFWHAGAPLILSIAATDDGPATDHLLGPDMDAHSFQGLVPRDHWQAARTTGDWTLVSCTVSPGFQFGGFTLAPPDFDIPRT